MRNPEEAIDREPDSIFAIARSLNSADFSPDELVAHVSLYFTDMFYFVFRMLKMQLRGRQSGEFRLRSLRGVAMLS